VEQLALGSLVTALPGATRPTSGHSPAPCRAASACAAAGRSRDRLADGGGGERHHPPITAQASVTSECIGGFFALSALAAMRAAASEATTTCHVRSPSAR
jgi:hypothetical protein